MSKGEPFLYLSIFFLCMLPLSVGQLQPSEKQILLRIQKILEYPPVLNGWTNWTNFCGIPPSSSLTLVCSENRVIELSVVGNKGSPSLSLKQGHHFAVSDQALSSGFSLDSLFTTLSKLSNLKVLSLVSLGLWGPLSAKISRFSSLQVLNISSNFIYSEIPWKISSPMNLKTLVLDDNMFSGSFPDWVSLIPGLSVLNLSNNSLNGPIPSSLATLKNLSVLILSANNFSGAVPDLSRLIDLEVLDLGGNFLGPDFPTLGNKLVSLVLRNNTFRSNIPPKLENYDLLQRLDLSFNKFAGPILFALFSLPAIQYLNLAGNKLSGALPRNLSCYNGLEFVDLSHNLLTGNLPHCLDPNSRQRVVLYSGNCLASNSTYQHPYDFCQGEALAAIMPQVQQKSSKNRLVLILGIAAGFLGGLAALGMLIWVLLRRSEAKKSANMEPQKFVTGNSSIRLSPSLLPSARYMPQSASLGALVLSPYHVYSVEELEEATNNFDKLNVVGEGSQGQLYKGQLYDGSTVVVRCLKIKQKHTPQSLTKHIELISKLRHRHLVSILGHCVINYGSRPNESTIFLVFEYVSNGTLRSHLTDRRKREMLKWPQRISVAIGIARGIQFLHTGIVPGIFGNDLKIENILLDQNCTAKISSYNLPILSKFGMAKVGSESPFSPREEIDDFGRVEDGDKIDVHQLGIILVQLIMGKHITSQSELNMLKIQLQASLTAGSAKLRGVTDPSIRHTFADDSLKTVTEITLNSLSEDLSKRPSIEDVLWNLQYSVQVQEGWSGNL